MSFTRNTWRFVGVGTAFLLASCVIVSNGQGSSSPSGNAPIVRGAESGKQQLFANFWSVTPECTSNGAVAVKVAKEPEHGRVAVIQGEAYPDFEKANVRSACNSKKLPATSAYYTSEPDFTGTDTVTLEAIGPAGRFFHNEYVINVR